MTWWHYLLLVNLYLLLFYGFYALLLRNETFFQLNRVYLVAGALLSFIIPVIQAEWIKQLFITQRVQQTIYSTIQHPEFIYQVKPAESLTFTVGQIFAVVYIGGTIFLLGRFFLQLLAVKKLIANLESSAAFSFFKKVRIDSELPDQQTIIDHEQVHVSQWHSADVLFIEAVMIINWFNPIVYFYRKAIKHVHEFIADKKAIERGTSKTEYAYLLLSQTFGANPHQLTNNFFNKSLLKQRIIMLNKDESKRRVLLKYGLSAPLFAAMLILSSATVKNSSVMRIINKKTELVFSMNTLPGPRQPIKEVVINAGQSAIQKQKPDDIKIKLAEIPTANETTAVQPADTKVDPASNVVFSAVELSPEFPGGHEAFSKFLQRNLRYPKEAKENNVEGKVYVQFVVEKDGSLNDMKVLREPGSGLGDEALRVLEMSPKWRPGMQNGNQVKVQYTVPVNFTLNDENNAKATTDTLRKVISFINRARLTGMPLNTAPGTYAASTSPSDKSNAKYTAQIAYIHHMPSDSGKIIYLVNGKEMTAEEFKKIQAEMVKEVMVSGYISKTKAPDDAQRKSTINVVLKEPKADQ